MNTDLSPMASQRAFASLPKSESCAAVSVRPAVVLAALSVLFRKLKNGFKPTRFAGGPSATTASSGSSPPQSRSTMGSMHASLTGPTVGASIGGAPWRASAAEPGSPELVAREPPPSTRGAGAAPIGLGWLASASQNRLRRSEASSAA